MERTAVGTGLCDTRKGVCGQSTAAVADDFSGDGQRADFFPGWLYQAVRSGEENQAAL